MTVVIGLELMYAMREGILQRDVLNVCPVRLKLNRVARVNPLEESDF